MNTCKFPWFLLLSALIICGCAGAVEKDSDAERKAFFAAAQQANLQGIMCMNPKQYVDLSAYAPFLGVKYPPTVSVDILSGPPSRPHQVFAVLQCTAAAASPSSGSLAPAVAAEFTAQAKSIGADAIIIRPSRDDHNQKKVESNKWEAVAIKYRLENLEKKREGLSPNTDDGK